jgi:hypothetical protein
MEAVIPVEAGGAAVACGDGPVLSAHAPSNKLVPRRRKSLVLRITCLH